MTPKRTLTERRSHPQEQLKKPYQDPPSVMHQMHQFQELLVVIFVDVEVDVEVVEEMKMVSEMGKKFFLLLLLIFYYFFCFILFYLLQSKILENKIIF
jgi:hypothetical protein